MTKDTRAPSVTIESVSKAILGPTDTSAELTFNADENGAFSVRVGGSSCTTGTERSSGTYSSHPTRARSLLAADDLEQGPNTVRVCVADAAANTGEDTTTVTKLTVSPNVTIDSVSDTLIGPGDQSTIVTWHADQNGDFSVRVGGSDCDSGSQVASGSYGDASNQQQATVDADAFQEGANTVRVCVTNVVGSTGSDSQTVTKDTTAPTVTIDSLAEQSLGAIDSSELTFHASEDGAYTLRRGGNRARRAPSSTPATTARARTRTTSPSRRPTSPKARTRCASASRTLPPTRAPRRR